MKGSSITPSSSSAVVPEVDVPLVSEDEDVLLVADVGLVVGFVVAFAVALVVAFVSSPFPPSSASGNEGAVTSAAVVVVSSSVVDVAASVLLSDVVAAVVSEDDEVVFDGKSSGALLHDLTPITTPTMMTRSTSTPANIMIVRFFSV
jgi:hypothetical protein